MLVALAWSSVAFCGEIHDAAKSGDLEKVKALLTGNPNLVFSKDNNGETPLHDAVVTGHKDVAELLVKSGHTVLGIDDLTGGFSVNVPPGVEFVEKAK